ncbi:MAG: LEPR-XLL domain-containing protein, partial [Planctomycetaceae bacterium]|nr:LEPR-XLL domain-containing protein [Planctomycetaceae bacterium]
MRGRRRIGQRRDADLRHRCAVLSQDLEQRLLLSADPFFQAGRDSELILRASDNALQLFEAAHPDTPIAARPLSAITNGARIDAAGYAVRLTIDSSVPVLPGGIEFDGGSGTSTLAGPSLDTQWTVDGLNRGYLRSPGFLRFQNVENLQGAADNDDVFQILGNGALSGLLHGGDRGFDTLVAEGMSVEHIGFTASSPDAGTITLDTTVIHYAGLEPIDIRTSNSPDSVELDLGQLDPPDLFDEFGLPIGSNDSPTLTPGSDSGSLTFAGSTFEDVTFSKPSKDLRILLGNGNDQLTIASGISLNADLIVDGQSGQDSVVVNGTLTLNGADLIVQAEGITIAGQVSTRTMTGSPATAISTGPSGNIFLHGEDVEVSPGAALYAQDNRAGITSFSLQSAVQVQGDWESKTYSGLKAAATSGVGSEMVLDVTIANGTATVNVVSAGVGYAAGDTITFVDPGDEEYSKSGKIEDATKTITVTVSKSAGNIWLYASQTGGSSFDVDVRHAEPTLLIDGATIHGDNVTLLASAATQNKPKSTVQQELEDFLLEDLKIRAGLIVSESKAEVGVTGNTHITADENVTIQANASSQSDNSATGALAVGVVVAKAQADAWIGSGASVTAGQTLTVQSNVDNASKSKLESDGGLPTVGSVVLGAAVIETNATSRIENGATITAHDVHVRTNVKNNLSIEAAPKEKDENENSGTGGDTGTGGDAGTGGDTG